MRHDAVVGRSFLKLATGEAVARLLAFGATVYLARRLGADVYGMIVLAAAVLLYATCLTEVGIDQLGIHDVAADRSRLPVLLPAYLGVRLGVATGLIALLVMLGLAVFPQPDGAVLASYALVLLPVALGSRWVHLGLERSGRAALARVLTEGIGALLIVLLVHGPGDVTRAPLAQLAGESAGALLLLRLLPEARARLVPALPPGWVRSLWRRAWPIVGHTLLGLLIFNSDFFFLRVFRDSGTVGYYAVAYTLVSFFLNLGSAYTLSLLPVLTRLRDQPAAERNLYDSAIAQVFAGALPVAAGGWLLAPGIIALLFGQGYTPAAAPLQILTWCIPIGLIRNVTQSVLVARGRQHQLLLTVAWAAGLNLLLNAIVIPLWGMTGAALATVGTEAVRTLLALWFCRTAGLPWPAPRRFWRALVAGAAMVLVLELAGTTALGIAIAVGAAVYGSALYLVGGLRLQRGALPELTV